MDLIHKLDKARTKDDLEALGIEHLGIDVDKREAKEVLRVKLINEAKAQGWESSEDAEPQQAAPVAPAQNSVPAAPKHATKMGRNKRTGRVMVWSSAMAKMPHMEEV